MLSKARHVSTHWLLVNESIRLAELKCLEGILTIPRGKPATFQRPDKWPLSKFICIRT